MTTVETRQQEEQQERALAVLRQMIADKHEDERKAIEDYRTNPELQQLISKLRHENTTVEQPLSYKFDVKLTILIVPEFS